MITKRHKHVGLEEAQRAKELVEHATTIHVYTHSNPDGDAVASVRAIELVLSRLNKKVMCRFIKPVPEMYKWLGIKSKIGPLSQEPDLIVIVDTERLDLLGEFQNSIKTATIQGTPILNIDHHSNNQDFGTVNIIASGSSTTQNLYELFRIWSVPMNKRVATSLLYGLIFDTYFFQRSNTDQYAFETASELAEIGAEPYFVSQQLYKSKSIESMQVLKKVIESIQLYNNGTILISVVPKEVLSQTKDNEVDFPGLSNFLAGITSVRISVLMKQVHKTHIEVSLRSEPIFDNRGRVLFGAADVSRVAQQFGGGGHKVAAGCSIHDKNIEEAKILLLESCLQALGYVDSKK
jgi:phosphoesterase RecJ-like protein